MTILRYLCLISVCLVVSGCSEERIEQHRGVEPKFNIAEFFKGSLVAEGIVYGYSNNVITLKEDFIFTDGEKSQRTWLLTLKNQSEFTGTAHDVVGTAEGIQMGNAVNMKYTLRVPYGDSTIDLSMDDWMYLMDAKTVLNRTSMNKFGIKVGELFLVIKKTP
jgi:hypothetical protein